MQNNGRVGFQSASSITNGLCQSLPLPQYFIDEKETENQRMDTKMNTSKELLAKVNGKYNTILVDPPWRFQNRTGKMAPEHKRLRRYSTMDIEEIKNLPIGQLANEDAHIYLWVPNALLQEGLDVLKAWGFTYKANLVWYKIRNDGGPDGRGVGFYFRNVTELVLFGVKGNKRTLKAGRTQVNIVMSRKREHSRKPDELYEIVEECSPGPYLELFARHKRDGWTSWGNELKAGESIQKKL
jgi:N6-adenosine-specific RNA methylase IME4